MIFPIDIKTIQDIEKSLPKLPKNKALAIRKMLMHAGDDVIKSLLSEIIGTDKKLSKNDSMKLIRSIPNILAIEELNGKYNIIPDLKKAIEGKPDKEANLLKKAFKKLTPAQFNEYLASYIKSATTKYEESMFQQKKANPDEILEKLLKNRNLADNSYSQFPFIAIIPKSKSGTFQAEMLKAGFEHGKDFILEHKDSDSNDFGFTKSVWNNSKAKNIIEKYNSNLGDKMKEYKTTNSNLRIIGKGKDTNGNSIVKLQFPNQRGFSIQTAGNLPKTKSILRNTDFTDLTSSDVEIISKEIVDYVKSYGSKQQKTSLKVYGELSDCGTLDLETPPATTISDKPKRKYRRRKKSNLSDSVDTVPGTGLSDGFSLKRMLQNDPLVKFVKRIF